MTALGAAAGFAVALVALIAGFLVLAAWNLVVALQQRIDKAWANIDVALKQRHDELPNLVEAVHDLMDYERETLLAVTRARAAYSPTAPIARQAAASAQTSAAIRQLFAVVERYPQIQSQSNVLALQQEIERLERVIADRRELYNDSVYRYNTRIRQLPAVLLAPLAGWRPRTFFEADATDTIRPSVELSA